MLTTVLRDDQVAKLSETHAMLMRAIGNLAASVDLSVKTDAGVTGDIVVHLGFVREIAGELAMQIASMGLCPAPTHDVPASDSSAHGEPQKNRGLGAGTVIALPCGPRT